MSYHSSAGSRRGGSIGSSHMLSGSGFPEKDSQFLPLPSSSKRKRNVRLPMGLNLTTSGGPLRRWPVVLLLLIVVLLCVTLIPRSGSEELFPAMRKGGFERDVNAGQADMHAVNEEDTYAKEDEVINKGPYRPQKPLKVAVEDEKEQLADLKKVRTQQIKELIFWMTRGGTFPDTFEPPSEDKFAKLGAEEFRKLLLGNTENADDSDIFSDGWEKDADLYNRITVFSKSYCPHSQRAKNILSKYDIVPGPHVIELDERADMSNVQLILKYLTGRRTVPNVMADFESLGGADEVELLDGEGVLRRKVENNPHLQALRDAEGIVKLED